MIPVVFVAAGLLTSGNVRRQSALWVAAGLWLVHPAIMLAVATGTAWVALYRRAKSRRVMVIPADDVVAFGELVSLALSSGASPHAAVELAAQHGPTSVVDEVGRVLRQAASGGSAVAFRGYNGALAPILTPIGHALASGAPLGMRVDGALGDLRAEVHAERMARVRRLPVQLLFPLTLLILPGFMILTLGPSLLTALDRLQF